MLTFDVEIERTGMTVPYPALFEPGRRNHGFVDLRGKPELVSKIPEAGQSPALNELLVSLSEPSSALFSLGCDLGTHEEPKNDASRRNVAGGYIQLACSNYGDRFVDDHGTFGLAVANAMEGTAEEHDWRLLFVLQLVVSKLPNSPEIVPSIMLWFYAAAISPQLTLASRELLLSSLHNALFSESVLSFFDENESDWE